MFREGLVLAFVLAVGVTAQVPALVGSVTDPEGRSLAGAVAYLAGAQRGAVANAQGQFVLDGPPEVDVLTLMAPGHHRASFAVLASDPARMFVLPRLEGAPREEPFEGALRLEMAARHLGIGVGEGVQAVPFEVAPGANGGWFDVNWSEEGPAPARLRASVVHAATGAMYGRLDGGPPLRFPLGGALLRDHPGAYELRVELYDGNALGQEAVVRGAVHYGPWIAKTVEGKAPEVRDPEGDRAPTQGQLVDMDVLAVRFTNETAEQLDIEMDLAELRGTAARPGTQGYWSVHWSYGGAHWAVFLQGDAGGSPAWWAGPCEPTLCYLDDRLPGDLLPGSPGRIRWHVPKASIGNATDGTRLEEPYALNFEMAVDRTPVRSVPLVMAQAQVVDRTSPVDGRAYVVGLDEFAIPRDAAERLRLAAGPAAAGVPVLALAGTAVALTAAPLALGWQRRRGRDLAGRYRVLRPLGRGASGATSLARDRVTGALVALKQCAANRPEDRERLVREARIASRIAHANVVRVLDVHEGPRADVLVMEYVPGGSLEDRLAQGPLALGEALGLWRDIVGGLDAIHAAGIVHRDVKPSNILLTAHGVAKLADFGVARAVHEETLGGAGPVGTPLYMAPEVLRGAEPTPASDLYAAAAVLYRMLAGRPHLDLQGHAWDALLERRRRRPQLPLPGVPAWVNELLARGLADAPGRRPTAAEALRALDRHPEGSGNGRVAGAS